MIKILVYILYLFSSIGIYSLESDKTNTTNINETEITEKFYYESIIILKNKINNPYTNCKATTGKIYSIAHLILSMNECNTIAYYNIGLAECFGRLENSLGSYSIRDVYGNKVPKNAIVNNEHIIWV